MTVTDLGEQHPLPGLPCPCPAGTRSPADAPCGGTQRANAAGPRGWNPGAEEEELPPKFQGVPMPKGEPEECPVLPRAEGSGTDTPHPIPRPDLGPGQECWDVPGRVGGTGERRQRGQREGKEEAREGGSEPAWAREKAERLRRGEERPGPGLKRGRKHEGRCGG